MPKFSKAASLAIAIGGLLVATSASAAPVVFTDEAAWLAAVSGVSTEDFESATPGDLAVGTTDIGLFSISIDANRPTSTQIRSAGEVNGTTEFSGWLRNGGSTFVDFLFDSPIFGFAADWGQTTTSDLLTVTVGGTTIKFSDFLSGPGDGFLGVVDTVAFSSIRFGREHSGEFGEIFSVDDVRLASGISDSTTVPEPTTLALIGAGLAGLGLTMRRRHAA